MYLLFVTEKVLRHVFTENLQTQTFIFTGTPLLQSNGNAALVHIWYVYYLKSDLKYLWKVFNEYNTIHTGSSYKFLIKSIKYLTNNKKQLSPMKQQPLYKVIPKNK